MSVPTPADLNSFLSAPSVDAWLEKELLDFFAKDMTDDRAAEFIESIRENARDEVDAFIETQVQPHETIAVILAFARPGEGEEGATGGIFRQAPGPIALLEMAANECEPLDEVIVSHRFASGEEVTISKTWPFGISGAFDLLLPSSEDSVEVQANCAP